MKRFGVAIALGAFLLFLVQPLMSKIILPWYGGSAALWTTCMLFFQAALLVGYCYAHVLTTWLSPRRQAIVHLIMIAGALVATFLFFPPDDSWRPLSGGATPYGHILWTLTATVGLPFCLLSANSPLLQAWFSKQAGADDATTYRLYSLSNIGSLLGLLAYPFVLEPLLSLTNQGIWWACLFVCYTVSAGLCALAIRKPAPAPIPAATAHPRPTGERPRLSLIVYWLVLSGAGSVILLAVTNQLCQDIAVIPFLWVVPLMLYLITFIIAFSHDNAYRRSWTVSGLLLAIAVAIWVMMTLKTQPLLMQICAFSALLFFGCLLFHGELARSKPGTRYLTQFYLLMSVGGVVGGLLVCIVAPWLLLGYWELHAVILCSIVVVLWALWRDGSATRWTSIGLVTVLVITGSLLWQEIADDLADDVETHRDFYGVLHVKDSAVRPGRLYYLFHGRTVHGCQIRDQDMRAEPTLYYTRAAGVGLALQDVPRLAEDGSRRPAHVGIVGMGVGTVAAFAGTGDRYRFFEIDPAVDKIARGDYFSYLDDAEARGAEVSVQIGDGRSLLKAELTATGSQNFDVMVLDAFSAGSVPTHLLTRECMELYWSHLKPNGILAVHVSNRLLDIKPVLAQAAIDAQREAVWISSDTKAGPIASPADWILITSDQACLETARKSPNYRPMPPRTVAWTDSYSHLLNLLR